MLTTICIAITCSLWSQHPRWVVMAGQENGAAIVQESVLSVTRDCYPGVWELRIRMEHPAAAPEFFIDVPPDAQTLEVFREDPLELLLRSRGGGDPTRFRLDDGQVPEAEVLELMRHLRFADDRFVHAAGWPVRCLSMQTGTIYNALPAEPDGIQIRWLPGRWPNNRGMFLPRTVEWKGLWIDTAVWGGFWGAMVYGVPTIRARTRARKGLCTRCGYDLGGRQGSPCPECGLMVRPNVRAKGHGPPAP